MTVLKHFDKRINCTTCSTIFNNKTFIYIDSCQIFGLMFSKCLLQIYYTCERDDTFIRVDYFWNIYIYIYIYTHHLLYKTIGLFKTSYYYFSENMSSYSQHYVNHVSLVYVDLIFARILMLLWFRYIFVNNLNCTCRSTTFIHYLSRVNRVGGSYSICAQWRHKRVCLCTQSQQNLHALHMPWAPKNAHSDTLSECRRTSFMPIVF